MQNKQLITALRHLAPIHGAPLDPGPICPDPADLAAWIDRRVMENPGGDRAAADRIEKHLADCPFCLQQLDLYFQSEQRELSVGVPVEWLRRAEAMHSRPTTYPAKRRWMSWAAAAGLVLATGMLVVQQQPATNPFEEPIPTTRFADRQAVPAGPKVIAPADGARVVPAATLVRWSEVPGSLYYDVRVVDADGELLLRERVEGTRWLLPESLVLDSGHEYFLRVDAWMTEAKVLSSAHVIFKVVEE